MESISKTSTPGNTGFRRPPRWKNSDGDERRVGFELEFGNVTVAETARALADSLGGELTEENPFVFTLEHPELGTLRIERDAELLHSVKYRSYLARLNIEFDPGTVARELEHGVDRLSSSLVPCEIVTEPLVFAHFESLNSLVGVLGDMQASGTQSSLVNAFGTHINPSAPDLEATTIRNYIQGMLLLYDWIVLDADTDFSRRYFTRFIDPFPQRYLEQVLRAEYAPDTRQLMDDYLDHNPTRNRALDMLPMFAEIDEALVQTRVKSAERSLIKKRPAFHYRLPDCRIGEPGWSIAAEWNRWWYVEVIAADDDLRLELIDSWQAFQRGIRLPFSDDWAKLVGKFLRDRIEVPGP